MAAARLAAALWAMLSLSAQAGGQGLPGQMVPPSRFAPPGDGVPMRLAQAPAGVSPGPAAAVPASVPLRFDIPAQALDDALQAFGRQTGWSLLYDTARVADRRSAPLLGEYSVADAIARLLAGSGMAVRFTSSEALLVVPDTQAQAGQERPAAVGGPPPGPRGDYYGRLQLRVTQALCGDPLTAPGRYRVALRFDIGPLHTVEHLQVRVAGRPDVEARVKARLSGLPVGGKPPADLRMPVTMVVLPEDDEDAASRSCAR